jgi:hypothetical protein
MTLSEAMAITNIHEGEFNRINLKALDYVIEDTKKDIEQTHQEHHKKYVEALEIIKKEVEK